MEVGDLCILFKPTKLRAIVRSYNTEHFEHALFIDLNFKHAYFCQCFENLFWLVGFDKSLLYRTERVERQGKELP
jgi:hypothetical protein